MQKVVATLGARQRKQSRLMVVVVMDRRMTQCVCVLSANGNGHYVGNQLCFVFKRLNCSFSNHSVLAIFLTLLLFFLLFQVKVTS